MPMQPEYMNIGNLLHTRFEYRVPKYQRPFSWENSELSDFLSDFDDLFQATIQSQNMFSQIHKARINQSIDEHFFGSIVSISHHVPGSSARHFELIDGQQRMATFILFLSWIYRELKRIRHNISQQYHAYVDALIQRYKNDYIFYHLIVHGQPARDEVRLKLSRNDEVFFIDVVESGNPGNATCQSHKRINNAHKLIKKHCNKYIRRTGISNNNKVDILNAMGETLIEKCTILHIVCDTPREAYRLFTTLNDRGLQLTASDLLRSLTLNHIRGDPPLQQRVEEYWDYLNANSKNLDLYIRRRYTSLLGSRPRRTALHEDYMRYLTQTQPNTIQDVHDRILTMKEEVDGYNDIIKGNWPYPHSPLSNWEKDRLNRLIDVLGHDLSIPLLLSAKACLTEQEFSEIVHLVEIACFRLKTVCNIHAGKLQEIYFNHTTEIRRGRWNINDLKNDLQTLQNQHASNTTFETLLFERIQYRMNSHKSNKYIKHFYLTLDSYYNSLTNNRSGPYLPDTTTVYDLRECWIEHIYPKSPQGGHIVAYLDDKKDLLPNLTILSPNDNRSANNDPFTQKRSYYQRSQIAITRNIGALQNWDQAEYDRNKMKILDWANRLFKI